MVPIKKFEFVVQPLEVMESVEIKILSAINQDWWKDPVKKLKEALASNNENLVLHARRIGHTSNLMIIETSKYNIQMGEYQDHMIWVFTKNGDQLTLNRYIIKNPQP